MADARDLILLPSEKPKVLDIPPRGVLALYLDLLGPRVDDRDRLVILVNQNPLMEVRVP